MKNIGNLKAFKWRPFEATQSYLIDTQNYNYNCYLITAWFAHKK